MRKETEVREEMKDKERWGGWRKKGETREKGRRKKEKGRRLTLYECYFLQL